MDIKDTPYISAAVLPVCVSPRKENLFLLGMEQYAVRNKRWCEFGGRRKQSDVDCFETAAREMCEECCHTLRVVGITHLSVENMSKFLRDGDYVCAIVLDKLNKGQRIIFVVHMEYDIGVCNRFSIVRAAMSETMRHQRLEDEEGQWVSWWLPGILLNPHTGCCKVVGDYYEKTSIGYFTYSDLTKVVETNGILPFKRGVSSTCYFRQDFVPLLRLFLPYLVSKISPPHDFVGHTEVLPWATQFHNSTS
jgi:hypothetical protein